MVNTENLKHTVLLLSILLAVEVLGNRLSGMLEVPDIFLVIIASIVLFLGIYFHIFRG